MARGSLVVGVAVGEGVEDSVAAGAYRPHLDGLRALAVYLVVLFHAGSGWFPGGYVGVDVFFVLSGYLVTQLLLRDVSRVGSIRFGRFYARRFRRLLPAAFVVLLVTGLVYTAIASPVEVASAVGSFKAAFLYVTNWYFIHHSNDYFGPDINANPVVQFWSLAVEEQFYLLWPLTLGGVFVVTRRLDRARQLRIIRWGVGIGAVASAAWALSLRGSNPTRAYYGTDARAYELLAGALLALLPTLVPAANARRWVTRIVPPVSVLLVVLLASDLISLGPISRGIGVTLVTCALLLTLEAAAGGVVKRALSAAPIIYLGKISYGTYLWHWIVILVMLRTFHLSTLTTIAIACLVATALASLSFELLEHPIRINRILDGHRRIVIAAGLTISVIAALVIVPKIVDPAHAATGAAKGTTDTILTPLPQGLRQTLAGETSVDRSCPVRLKEACTLVAGTKGRVLLLGDSQAESMTPMFAEIAEQEHLTLSRVWFADCPWQQNLYNAFAFGGCKKTKDDVYKHLVEQLDPDLVVVVELDYGESLPVSHGLRGRDGKPVPFSTVERETESSLAALRAGGRRVLLIEPPPVPVLPRPAFNPESCIATARWVEDCRYTARSSPSPVQLLYRRLADGVNVRSLDLGPMICPLLPVCDPIADGRLVKRDPVHLARGFAASLAPRVDLYLRAWASAGEIAPRERRRASVVARGSLVVGVAVGEGVEDSVAAGAYRPHLDGLRALAVYLVVLFHAGSGWFPGGYVGVDVFFVLSGYLVTQLLLRDVSRVGSIRFGRFYARRFRRLLPAAFVVLLVTGLVYTAIASPVEVASAVGSFKAAFLYVTNWYFIHHSNDYFGPDINANPVVQFWSLAVEEQFYLLWPLTLGGVFVVTRRLDRARQLRIIRWGVGIGAVASAAWALSLRGSNPTRAYYGTDARAYELLAGALLALLPTLVPAANARRWVTRIVPPVSVLLVVLLASDLISLGPISRGIGVTLVTCALLLTLEAAAGGVVKRALSAAPIIYLGKISYGTYLWHWIVILVMLRTFHLSTLTTIAIACLVATALASLSFELLEHPIRINRILDGHRRIVIAAGLTISVIAALVIVPKIVDPAHAATGAAKGTTDTILTPLPDRVSMRRDLTPFLGLGCAAKVDEACQAVTGDQGAVLLLGDSQAVRFEPLFAAVARREHLTLWTMTTAGCPWQRNLFTRFALNACKRMKEHAYQDVLTRVDPTLVVLAETVYGVPGPAPGELQGADKKPASVATIERETTSSVTELRAAGRNVLLMESVPLPLLPNPSFRPPPCLANARYVEQCRYTARTTPWPIESVFRGLAQGDPGVRSLDLDRLVCPQLPICDPVVAGVVVKEDSAHITGHFSRTLAPYVDDYLRSWTSTGVIPARSHR